MDEFFTRRVDKDVIEVFVQEWRRRFQGHKENAILEISRFVVKCCGATSELDENDLTDDEAKENFLTRIEEETQARPDFAPNTTISPGDWHANLLCYFKKWTEVSVPDVVTDPTFSPFYQFLIELSECTTQVIRLLATFILLKLGTELLSTCIVTRGSRHIQRLRNMTREIVNRVFNERYKDGSRYVRALVMKEITIWFNKYKEAISPKVILQYAIDNLSDAASAIRLESATILDLFVANIETMPDYLRAKLSDKKNVLIEMTFEINHHLSCAAITLLTNVITLCPDFLTVEEHKSIMWNIYDPNSSSAKQAAKFFVATFPSLYENSFEKIDFLITYFESIEFRPEILGTVMYGEFEPLADYESIVQYLVDSDDHVKALKYLKLVTHHAMCLIKDGIGPAGPKRKKRKTNVEELRSKFVRAFSPHTRELLEKYDFEHNDDWAFTFRIFFQVYEHLLENELPNP